MAEPLDTLLEDQRKALAEAYERGRRHTLDIAELMARYYAVSQNLLDALKEHEKARQARL